MLTKPRGQANTATKHHKILILTNRHVSVYLRVMQSISVTCFTADVLVKAYFK